MLETAAAQVRKCNEAMRTEKHLATCTEGHLQVGGELSQSLVLPVGRALACSSGWGLGQCLTSGKLMRSMTPNPMNDNCCTSPGGCGWGEMQQLSKEHGLTLTKGSAMPLTS